MTKEFVEIKLDIRDALHGFDALKREAPKACARALNRAIVSVQSVAVKTIAKDLAPVKQKSVRDTMKIVKATPQKQTATLVSTGRRIPLLQFGARGPEPSRGRGSGVAYRMQGARKRLPAGFIARMSSGHRGVFVREGVKVPPARGRYAGTGILRQPIRERFGPSVPKVFMNAAIQRAMQTRGHEALITNLQHEMSYALRGRKGE